MNAAKRFLSFALILGAVVFLASMKDGRLGLGAAPEAEAPALTVILDENGKPRNRPKPIDIDMTRLWADDGPPLSRNRPDPASAGMFAGFSNLFSGNESGRASVPDAPMVLRGGGAFRAAGGAVFRKARPD